MAEAEKTNNEFVVTLAGSVNAGKSSLFNVLSGARRAIVAREPHTTRDSVEASVAINGAAVRLIDSAGLGKLDNALANKVAAAQKSAFERADLFLFVADITTGFNQSDQLILKKLRNYKKPTILVLNKADNKVSDEILDSFKGYGVKEIIEASAIHKIGIEELRVRIASLAPKTAIAKGEESLKLAFIGRPNVGKSSLTNAIAAKNEAIVSELAGTTRDTKYISAKHSETNLTVADTAGIRRRGKIEVGIEHFATDRARFALSWADVCILVLDATEIATAQDQHLAGEIKDAGRGLILAVNKIDMVEEQQRDKILAKMRRDFAFAWWAPVVFVSAETGENIEELFNLAKDIYERRNLKITTQKLNRILAEIKTNHPPASGLRLRPKLNYVTQTGTRPPEFSFFGTHPDAIHFSYRRYVENQLREHFEFTGTPIKLNFMDKHK